MIVFAVWCERIVASSNFPIWSLVGYSKKVSELLACWEKKICSSKKLCYLEWYGALTYVDFWREWNSLFSMALITTSNRLSLEFLRSLYDWTSATGSVLSTSSSSIFWMLLILWTSDRYSLLILLFMLCLLECLFFQQLYLSLGWTLDYLYFTWLADWFTSGFKLFEISFDDVTVSFTSFDYFMV